MNSIFAPDSKLMKILNRLSDWIILNMLFVISSIPVFTIGAAATALYDGVQRIQESRASGWKTYWAAFRRDFKRSTILWLILAGSGFMIGYGFVFYFKTDAAIGGLGRIVCIIASIIWLLTSAWVFPIHAKYENSVKQTIKNAMLCGCMFLPQTFVAVLLNAVPVVVCLLLTSVFLKMSVVWFMLWFSVSAAAIHNRFQKPFAKMNREETVEESTEEVQDEENV